MNEDAGPIFRQVAALIENAIVDGSLAEEAQAPSSNELSAFHRINPATAAKAFQQLTDEGYLYKRRGIGMFVSADAQKRLREQRREHFFDDVVRPMVAEARAIGIDLREIIHHLNEQGR